MSSLQQWSWSDSPNAPKIPPVVYYFEKVPFAGNFVTAIPYGVVIMPFFKCMAALFDHVHRRGEPIKWGLVTYTVVMFSLVTIGIAMQLHFQFIPFIDNRQFPGVEGVLALGPITYQDSIASVAIEVLRNEVQGSSKLDTLRGHRPLGAIVCLANNPTVAATDQGTFNPGFRCDLTPL